MNDFHIHAITIIFFAVILVIAFDLMDMVLAALLGLCALTVTGSVDHKDVLNAVLASEGSLALLFGGMVVARVLAPTGIFDHVGMRLLILSRGSGKRFLLLLTLLTSVVCAILPNATTVILLAPIVIRVCREFEVGIVGPMVLTAVVSNSAGLLTLVGDPATFLVGQAMGLTFLEYLKEVSLGGVMAILALIPLMPLLMSGIWRRRIDLSPSLRPGRIERPGFCFCALATLMVMVGLFLFGEMLPSPIAPPAAAIIGASLALLVYHSVKVEPLDAVLRDIDWKTILFIFCMMTFVQVITKTGVLAGLSRAMHDGFDDRVLMAGFMLLATVGLASGFLANIPVVAAAIVMTKGYLVLTHLVPEEALGAGFTDWPAATLPAFVAMMFGATLGGNATLIGASANLVSAGVCASKGSRITFGAFLRFGGPAMVCQLAVSALYIWLFLYKPMQ